MNLGKQGPPPKRAPSANSSALSGACVGDAGLVGGDRHFFALETLLGGSEIGPVLTRLGANLPARTLNGDYWRLISSIFLHIGWLHLFANGMVLALLGPFFEKLVGSKRFLLLFFLSGMAGSGASAAFSGADLSAGASGALWGLLGASLGLSLFPGPVFPPPWVRTFRKNTLINLGINLYLSTLANIDFAAHLGGGAVGLLLFASGLLTRGLPVQPQHPIPRPLVKGLPRAVVLLCFSAAVALSIPFLKQKPQELLGTPALIPKTYPLDLADGASGFKFQVALPYFLELQQQDQPLPQAHRFVWGSIKNDPVAVVVSWIPFADTLQNKQELQAAAEEVQAEREQQILRKGASAPEGFVWLKDLAFPTFQRRIEWSNGLQQINVSQTQPNALVDVQLIVYDVYSDNYRTTAQELLSSFEIIEAGEAP